MLSKSNRKQNLLNHAPMNGQSVILALLAGFALTACGQNAHLVQPGAELGAQVTQAKPATNSAEDAVAKAAEAEEAARKAQENLQECENALKDASDSNNECADTLEELTQAKDDAEAAAEQAKVERAEAILGLVLELKVGQPLVIAASDLQEGTTSDPLPKELIEVKNQDGTIRWEVVDSTGGLSNGSLLSHHNCRLLAQIFGQVAGYTYTYSVIDGNCAISRTDTDGFVENHYFGPGDRIQAVKVPIHAQDIATVTIGKTRDDGVIAERTVLQVTAVPHFNDNQHCDCGTTKRDCDQDQLPVTDPSQFDPTQDAATVWDQPIQFGYNQAKLLPAGLAAIDSAIAVIKANMLKGHTVTRIEIIGHTDNHGVPKANLELSIKRAETVKKALFEKLSTDATTSNSDWQQTLVASGKGEAEPKFCTDKATKIESSNCSVEVILGGNRKFNDDQRAGNRRVEFKIHYADSSK